MSNPKRPVNIHKGYHAHVYFDRETLDFASRLCAEAGAALGRPEDCPPQALGFDLTHQNTNPNAARLIDKLGYR